MGKVLRITAPKAWIEGALHLIFPPKCVFCQAVLHAVPPDAVFICKDCTNTLPRCTARRQLSQNSSCIAPFYYESTVRSAILRYKFQGAEYYSNTFAVYMVQRIQEQISEHFDYISWVPVSKKRLRQRGYDQARILAETVAQSLSVEAISGLYKQRHNPAQSSLKDVALRQTNVKNAYVLKCKKDLRGKTVLLIDDVVTTGATLSECVHVLRAAGVSKIICVALAMVRE